MVTIDRWFFSLRLLSQGQLRSSPSSRDNTLLSCPQSDHDLRVDSATEDQQSCSKLAESGSIILTAHKFLALLIGSPFHTQHQAVQSAADSQEGDTVARLEDFAILRQGGGQGERDRADVAEVGKG